MSQYDDEFDGPDEFEGTDPDVRELRTEIIRLEALLDQLQASVRERAAETAEIRTKLAELEVILERLKVRRRRDEKLLRLLFLVAVLSLVLSLCTYLTV